MAIQPDETAALYAGRCTAALPPIVRNAVDPDKIEASDNIVHIKAVGGASLDDLTKVQGARISARMTDSVLFMGYASFLYFA